MKIKYDPEVDILYIRFLDGPVEESDEEQPGVILDYDQDNQIVGMEIMEASKRVSAPYVVEFTVQPQRVKIPA